MNEEILKRIDALAAKLNTTGEQLFGVLVKQSRIDGIEYTVYAAICCLVALSCVVWMFNALEDENGDQQAGAILVGLAALFAGFMFADRAIVGLFNPQFGAITALGHLIGGAK